MAQVVAINWEYGIETFFEPGTEVITLDLDKYDDTLIDQREYDMYFKRKMDSITLPAAKQWLEDWIRGNSYEEIQF